MSWGFKDWELPKILVLAACSIKIEPKGLEFRIDKISEDTFSAWEQLLQYKSLECKNIILILVSMSGFYEITCTVYMVGYITLPSFEVVSNCFEISRKNLTFFLWKKLKIKVENFTLIFNHI